MAHRVLSSRASLVLATSLLGVSAYATPAMAEAPAGAPSNLGLCSPFLGSLDPVTDPVTGETLGGNARSGVNLLINRYGMLQPDQLANPGQLYSVRAHEHPTASAADECLPRRQG